MVSNLLNIYIYMLEDDLEPLSLICLLIAKFWYYRHGTLHSSKRYNLDQTIMLVESVVMDLYIFIWDIDILDCLNITQ